MCLDGFGGIHAKTGEIREQGLKARERSLDDYKQGLIVSCLRERQDKMYLGREMLEGQRLGSQALGTIRVGGNESGD